MLWGHRGVVGVGTSASRLARIGLTIVAAACSGAGPGTAEVDGSTSTSAPAAVPPVELSPAGSPVGTVSHGVLAFAGRERTYRLYVPSELPPGPVPLFIALHGGTGWADQFAATDHSEALAETNGFLVVHPDGVPLPGVTDSRGAVWNGGVCCGVAARDDVDDVGFIHALLDQLVEDHPIDPARVYAFGHSNGGIMSYRLACELSDRIVGIGVVAGTLGVEDCAPARPVSVIHVHGTDDENLPLAGGIGTRSVAGVDFPPPRDGFAELATLNGCGRPIETAEGAITTAARGPCDGGTALAFVTIEGADHPWPGGTPIVAPASGDTYAGYDATAEIVRFLLSHPRT